MGPRAFRSSPQLRLRDPLTRADTSRRLQGVGSAGTWQCPGPSSPEQHLVAMGTRVLVTLQRFPLTTRCGGP